MGNVIPKIFIGIGYELIRSGSGVMSTGRLPPQLDRQSFVIESTRVALYDTDFPKEWLEESLLGNDLSKSRMFEWVHGCALIYFISKCSSEPLLSTQDAQDLASECVYEFSKSWRRVRSVSHYCRRMYKNNLLRFLKKKRRNVRRECTLSSVDIDQLETEAVSVYPQFEFESLNDEDRLKVKFASEELQNAEEIIRELFHYRVFEGAMTYREISELVDATETSLRMRMARFNRRVRDRYAKERARHRLGC